MLTLTRKVGEKIFFILPDGREMMIIVREIRKGHVRIGTEAPADVKIFRGEIREKEENEE